MSTKEAPRADEGAVLGSGATAVSSGGAATGAAGRPQENGEEDLQREYETRKLADGIKNVVKPTVLALDAQVQQVLQGQDELSSQLDALSSELKRFSDLAVVPSIAEHTKKLSQSKRRVRACQSTLKIISERLARMEEMTQVL